MSRSFGRIVVAALFLLLCMTWIGCSSEPKRATVQGKVTWKGQQPNLKGLRISFIGVDNKSIITEVALNGDYTAKVLPGENLVAVSWQAPPEAFPHLSKQKKDVSPSEMLINPMPASPIPIRYANPASSGLKCVVEADKPNEYNVDLVD